MRARKYEKFEIDKTIRDISRVNELLGSFKLIKNCKNEETFNISCSFDIETTSFYHNNRTQESRLTLDGLNKKEIKEYEKQACMYAFVFGINGKCIIGRTWIEALEVFKFVSQKLKLSPNRKLICYIHNFSYEFQFFRHYFNWINVFASEERRPIKALCDLYIEFRDSLQLSGLSLDLTCKNLKKYKIEKLVGDLDYKLFRHSKTPLTNQELNYILNDGLGVMCYIQELIEEHKNISRIALTKTGFVRKECRKKCIGYGNKRYQSSGYKKMISRLTLEYEEYLELKRAFHGGFTHANALHSGNIIHNVISMDFASSYPSCAVSDYFPMSKGEKREVKTLEEFNHYLNKYCCLFDIEFEDLEPKVIYENPLSSSKCYLKENVVENNGRVVSAKRIRTTLTELDFGVIKNFYTWKEIKIANLIVYKRGYLPTPLVKCILEFYGGKTKLKELEGEVNEIKYAKFKELINAIYGMIVTDILRKEISYENNEWNILQEINSTEELEKYNTSFNRFLFYPWGVWITAHAYYNLFTGIKACGEDYNYSDTDSIKVSNFEKHKEYFEKYNEFQIQKLKKASLYHGIDLEEFTPKDIKGIIHPLGVWSFDGSYQKFKTLGAKRYIYLDEKNKLHATIAGINKKEVVKFLVNESRKQNKDVFELFNNNLYVPKEYTGKNTHTYIDNAIEGYLIDYLGNKNYYSEMSYIHLEQSDYNLSMSEKYIDYLINLREGLE